MISLWTLVGLSVLLGYCMASALYFLDALVHQIEAPIQAPANLPPDEQKWREMLKPPQKY